MTKTKRVGKDLAQGPILPLLIAFAGPLLLANLLQQLYNTVDMIVIGQYMGSIGTVGVSNGGEVATVITFISTAFGSAAQIYIAQLAGAREQKAISEAIMTSIILTIAMSVVSTVLCLILCDTFLHWLNCPQEAFAQAHNYMMIVSFGLPFVFGYSTVCGVLRGLGESRRPLYFVAVATVVNIVLDFFLVVVIPLEAAGTAIATVAAQLASFVAALLYLYRRKEVLGIELSLGNVKLERKHMVVLLKLGIPMAAQSALIHCTQLICSAHVNSFGLVASATNSIGNRISKLVNVFTNSISTGAGAMVGQCFGAKKYDRVREVVHITLKCTLPIAFALSVFAMVLPEQTFALFTTDAEVIAFGRTYMRACIIMFILASFQGAYVSVVTGVGYAKLNFIIGVLDGVVLRLGISFLLAYAFELGVVGFFYGNTLARLGPVSVGLVYYLSGKWRTRRLLSDG